MRVKRYNVYDTTHNIVRSFNSYVEANNFRIAMQRFDWTIE